VSAKTAADLAAFRAKRQTYLGGTDLAAIMGFSKWESPLSVYLAKTGQEAPKAETMAMRRGLYMERFIADEFTREHPELVCWQGRPVVRDDWGFPAGASIDRNVARIERPRTPVALLEAKTAYSFSGLDWNEATGELPDAYYIQVQWYLGVSELPLAYAVADTGDPEKLTIIPVEPDQRVIDRLVRTAHEFWHDNVLAERPPQPIGLEADARALRSLYPESVAGQYVDLEATDESLVDEYLRAKAAEKEAGAAAETARQRLIARLGEAEAGIGERYRITYKSTEATRIDSKRLRADLPELAASYSTRSTSRRFLTKEI
jgi:putative phage-type endonuclease